MKDLVKLIKWSVCFMKTANDRPEGAQVLLTLVALVVAPKVISACADVITALGRFA